jgi:hypothetical protein
VRLPRLPLLGTIGGIAVGVAVAAVLITGGHFDGRVTPVPVPDASEAFVTAFQRSIEGTYVVEADYTRVLTDGRTLRSRALVAQRPPDSVRRQFGGITGTVAGRTVTCSSELGGQFHCGGSAPAPDPTATMQQEMDNLRSYFAPPALYRATSAGTDCFKLTQDRPSAVLPFGSAAKFCFDPGTGAIRILTQRLEGATDTFEATLVRGEVTDADFSLAADDAFGVQTDGADSAGGGIPDPGATATSGG